MIHHIKKITVDKRNGLLANEKCPDQVLKEVLVTNIHSEKPDDPFWEAPVYNGWKKPRQKEAKKKKSNWQTLFYLNQKMKVLYAVK